MNRDLVEWLACPTDSAHFLQLVTVRTSGRIEEGELRCASCGCGYPIEAGIPSFLTTDENGLSKLQQREKEAREREYGGRETYESLVEHLTQVDAVRSALGECRGLRVLDAGCGNGGLTQVTQSASRLVAFDFARSGLLDHRLRGSATVDLVQADVCRMPFRDSVFDASISTGVLQHLPSEAQREAFFGHLHRTLKPGGKLVVTTFNWNSHHRQAGVPKEGFFDNGIYRRRFLVQELRAELAKHFEVEATVPVQVFLPRTYRLVQALGRKAVIWDRFWRKRALSYAYSNHLLALCRRRG